MELHKNKRFKLCEKTQHNLNIARGSDWFFLLYSHFPITKERVIGTYEIDNRFYPGKNSDWQKDHFFFEITKDNEFIFNEKLKDGSIKTVRGRIEWYRDKPPMLYRIIMDNEHPLIDPTPALYRGNRKFYYVFESKFGNMFYRKTEQNSKVKAIKLPIRTLSRARKRNIKRT